MIRREIGITNAAQRGVGYGFSGFLGGGEDGVRCGGGAGSRATGVRPLAGSRRASASRFSGTAVLPVVRERVELSTPLAAERRAWPDRSGTKLFRTSNGDASRLAGPNTSRLFAGRFRRAVVQSVGAGCCAAGTPSIQIRHFPAGGIISRGTTSAVSRVDVA